MILIRISLLSYHRGFFTAICYFKTFYYDILFLRNSLTVQWIIMKTRSLVLTALIAALLCVTGPLTIPLPISPVPVTLLNFVLCISIYLTGWKQAFISTVLYLLLGLVGLPVFASFKGGLSVLAGPTGGYLIGYLFFVLVSGILITKFPQKKAWQIASFAIGFLVLYAFGSIWLSIQMNIDFTKSLLIGAVPYLPGDIVKVILAIILGPYLKSRIIKVVDTVSDINK